MSQGECTIIAAVEMELTKARAILDQLAGQIGRQNAEDVFFRDFGIITAENAALLQLGGQLNLGQELKGLAPAILSLEIIHNNKVMWRDR